MILNAFIAAIHYLALGIGLTAVVMRYSYLKSFDAGNPLSIKRILTADNFWALAALLWIVTGLWRAFGGLEKGTAYYISNYLFWLKVILFLLIVGIEIKPITTFIKWRGQLGRNGRIDNVGDLNGLIRASEIEIALVLAIPFVASLMARGFGSA